MLYRHAHKANLLQATLQSLFLLRTRKLTIKTNVTRHTCILVGYIGTQVEEEASFLLLQLCTLACETLSSSRLAAAHGVFLLTAPQNSPLVTKSHRAHMDDSELSSYLKVLSSAHPESLTTTMHRGTFLPSILGSVWMEDLPLCLTDSDQILRESVQSPTLPQGPSSSEPKEAIFLCFFSGPHTYTDCNYFVL